MRIPAIPKKMIDNSEAKKLSTLPVNTIIQFDESLTVEKISNLLQSLPKGIWVHISNLNDDQLNTVTRCTNNFSIDQGGYSISFNCFLSGLKHDINLSLEYSGLFILINNLLELKHVIMYVDNWETPIPSASMNNQQEIFQESLPTSNLTKVHISSATTLEIIESLPNSVNMLFLDLGELPAENTIHNLPQNITSLVIFKTTFDDASYENKKDTLSQWIPSHVMIIDGVEKNLLHWQLSMPPKSSNEPTTFNILNYIDTQLKKLTTQLQELRQQTGSDTTLNYIDTQLNNLTTQLQELRVQTGSEQQIINNTLFEQQSFLIHTLSKELQELNLQKKPQSHPPIQDSPINTGMKRKNASSEDENDNTEKKISRKTMDK